MLDEELELPEPLAGVDPDDELESDLAEPEPLESEPLESEELSDFVSMGFDADPFAFELPLSDRLSVR